MSIFGHEADTGACPKSQLFAIRTSLDVDPGAPPAELRLAGGADVLFILLWVGATIKMTSSSVSQTPVKTSVTATKTATQLPVPGMLMSSATVFHLG